jgi:aerobic carbon-monoxide dehydrogenase medium subunit
MRSSGLPLAPRGRAPRLVFFGAGTMPVDAQAAAQALGESGLAAAQDALAEDLDPPADLQADAATRRHLARVLLARVVRSLEGESA